MAVASSLLSLSIGVGCAEGGHGSALDDCGGAVGAASDAFIDCILDFDPGEGSEFGHDLLPDVLRGPPRGSLDVVSLGCEGRITLGFSGQGIIDGEGPDLVVFENPFAQEFPEPGQVRVSEDGHDWRTFACDPITLAGCAGVTPTLALPSSGIDPLDWPDAGGDAFDLAALGLTQVHFVRIEDRSREYWAAIGMDYCDPGQDGKGGFDLDAVGAIHGGS